MKRFILVVMVVFSGMGEGSRAMVEQPSKPHIDEKVMFSFKNVEYQFWKKLRDVHKVKASVSLSRFEDIINSSIYYWPAPYKQRVHFTAQGDKLSITYVIKNNQKSFAGTCDFETNQFSVATKNVFIKQNFTDPHPVSSLGDECINLQELLKSLMLVYGLEATSSYKEWDKLAKHISKHEESVYMQCKHNTQFDKRCPAYVATSQKQWEIVSKHLSEE